MCQLEDLLPSKSFGMEKYSKPTRMILDESGGWAQGVRTLGGHANGKGKLIAAAFFRPEAR